LSYSDFSTQKKEIYVTKTKKRIAAEHQKEANCPEEEGGPCEGKEVVLAVRCNKGLAYQRDIGKVAAAARKNTAYSESKR